MEAEGKTIPAQLSQIGGAPVQDVRPDADRRHAAQRRLVVPHRPGHAHPLVWRAGAAATRPRDAKRILEGKDKKYKEMMRAALDPDARPIEIFGSERDPRAARADHRRAGQRQRPGAFQVNVPNNGALEGVPDDVAVEVPAIVNKMGIQPLKVTQLPKKVMLEKILPAWLRMEHNLEALKSGDMSMQLFGILDSHGVGSYDQAVEIMEALLTLPTTEPMAHIESFEDHYSWPDTWDLPS